MDHQRTSVAGDNPTAPLIPVVLVVGSPAQGTICTRWRKALRSLLTRSDRVVGQRLVGWRQRIHGVQKDTAAIGGERRIIIGPVWPLAIQRSRLRAISRATRTGYPLRGGKIGAQGPSDTVRSGVRSVERGLNTATVANQMVSGMVPVLGVAVGGSFSDQRGG